MQSPVTSCGVRVAGGNLGGGNGVAAVDAACDVEARGGVLEGILVGKLDSAVDGAAAGGGGVGDTLLSWADDWCA